MRAARPELIYEEAGFLRASDIQPNSRYELHDGHPIYCAPTNEDGARSTLAGAEVLDTDPAVKEAGIDAGFSPSPGMAIRDLCDALDIPLGAEREAAIGAMRTPQLDDLRARLKRDRRWE